MKTIVDTIAVEYEEQGAGPSVLLLHGWKDNLRTFDPLLAVLGTAFRIVRLDLPGFGGSESPKTPWRVGEYARFVRHFCDKLGVRPDIVIGHSFGGRVAIRGYADGVLTPEKLVLMASAGIAKHRTLRNRLPYLVAKVGKAALSVFPYAVRERFRSKLYKKIGSDYKEAGKLRKTFLMATHEDLSEAARKINAPTLLIWGTTDSATPLLDGKRYAELISGSRLEVIEGAGHFVHQEQPEAVAELIRSFVRS